MDRVRVGSGMSKWRCMQEELPQGSVSSPVLFLIYANEWKEYEEDEVQYIGYVGDLAIWSSGSEVKQIQEKLQKALVKAR